MQYDRLCKDIHKLFGIIVEIETDKQNNLPIDTLDSIWVSVQGTYDFLCYLKRLEKCGWVSKTTKEV